MSGKSKEEIAFELVSKLKGVGVWGENNMVAILDMYAKCLEATSGLREIDGRKPSALQLKDAKSESAIAKAVAAATPVQAAVPAPQQAVAATRQAAPVQPAVQPSAQPVVRQQQEQLQQAFQQQQVP